MRQTQLEVGVLRIVEVDGVVIPKHRVRVRSRLGGLRRTLAQANTP